MRVVRRAGEENWNSFGRWGFDNPFSIGIRRDS